MSAPIPSRPSKNSKASGDVKASRDVEDSKASGDSGPSGSPGPSVLTVWLWAIRPRTLPLAAAAIVLGCGLAGLYGAFSLPVFVLALLTALLLQILSNLANDYGDAVAGTDTPDRLGPLRVVSSGLTAPGRMLRAIVLAAGLAVLSGAGLLLVGTWGEPLRFGLFVLLGICSVLAAMGYTMGKRPYGYRGWGDLMAGLFFGPVAVLGSAALCGAALTTLMWLPAVAAGLCSTAVLNINNLRDIHSDYRAGKLTVAVRLGVTGAARYHALLSLLTLSAWCGFWLALSPPQIELLLALTCLLAIPLMRSAWLVVTRAHDPACLNAQLRATVLGSALLNSGMGFACWMLEGLA